MSGAGVADDLFAGAGGWDLAAAKLGIHARGVENMKEARATRDAAGLTTIHDDVWTFRPDGKATGLIASPPCQTFSQAGSGSGRKALDDVNSIIPLIADLTIEQLKDAGKLLGDDRTALVLTPLWYALHHPYSWLAWEQVPTVLPVWEACAALLRAKGWHVWTGKLHAEQYGVPQTRTRAFLIASRGERVAAPTPTHSRYYSRSPERLDEGVSKWVSMSEALAWGTSARPSEVVYVNSAQANAARRTADRPAPTAHFGERMNLVEWQQPLTAACEECGNDDPCDGYTYCSDCMETLDAQGVVIEPTHMGDVRQKNGCVRPVDEPAPTILGSMDNGNVRWVHNPREMTPDELPRFAQQSDNPIDYDWPDNRPATVVAGRDIVQAPGATANRYNGSTKSRNDGVRVSVEEAGVLQSFPADHPWQGNKSKRYLQAGNAVPPLLAEHVLVEAAGLGERSGLEWEDGQLDLFSGLIA